MQFRGDFIDNIVLIQEYKRLHMKCSEGDENDPEMYESNTSMDTNIASVQNKCWRWVRDNKWVLQTDKKRYRGLKI